MMKAKGMAAGGMKKGGVAGGMKKGGAAGGMKDGGEAKKTGASGARMSNEDAGPAKNKVRGAGAAIRGVRPAMMK